MQGEFFNVGMVIGKVKSYKKFADWISFKSTNALIDNETCPLYIISATSDNFESFSFNDNNEQRF